MKQRICRTPFLMPLLVLCLLFAGCLGSAPPKPGMITEYALPTGASDPYAITSGPDGNLWFGASNMIGRITPQGTITAFALPPSPPSGHPVRVPSRLIVGPDKALWFTLPATNNIGRITLSGVISVFAVPTPDSSPLLLTAGPGGTIWFTEQLGNKIARITPPKPSAAQESSLAASPASGLFLHYKCFK